ncbi:MAG: maleylpyruvate isomerase N-terminal domain-containing protein [Actinomycetota bacterium]
MSIREELLDQEAEAWAAFEPRLRSGEGLAFGWTHAEVAGHLAYWMQRCALMLEAAAEGPIDDDAFAVDIDAENDARRPGWAATPVEEALAAAVEARERVLRAWAALDEPSGSAASWFEGDTFEHYDEHTGGS